MRIRPMALGDASAVAGLCTQLGYPASPAEVARRLAQLAQDTDNGLFVAEVSGGRVAGWVHVHGRHLLEVEPYAELGGLVVDEGHRGQGLGRALMAEAERWAAERGYGWLRIRSNTARAGAYHFYRQLGYDLVKSQHVFAKLLHGEQ